MVNFNTKGHCLINKLDKISVTNNVRKSFKETMGIKFPQRVKTYDIVELGHDFKPEINNTKIFFIVTYIPYTSCNNILA